jgi:hypothetical protein
MPAHCRMLRIKSEDVMAAEDFSESRADVTGNRKPEFRGSVN